MTALAEKSWVWGGEGTVLDYTAPAWAYDIETNGKELTDPEMRILMLGVYDGKTCVVFGPQAVGVGLDRMAEATRSGVAVVGHNSIGFDAEYLFEKCGTYVAPEDTMILAHCVHEEHPLGLEANYRSYVKDETWKEQVNWNWAELTDADLEKVADYNADDVIKTLELWNALTAKAKETGVNRDYDIRRKGTIVFDHVLARNGIALDVPALRTLRADLLADAAEALAIFEGIVGHKVNLNSPPQVGRALFETLGLHPVKWTKGGKKGPKPSTDVESLKRLLLEQSWIPGDPSEKALRALLKSRKSGKLASMLEAYEKHCVQVEDHWRIAPTYFSWTTTTGRSTANKGFQQWPHDPRVRGLLTARPGYTLLSADYAQLQMRLAAQISGSPTMRRLFKEKIDPHTWMAGKITGKEMPDVTKDERYVTKPVNFSLLFGAEPYTLRVQALKDYDLVFDDEQAQLYHDIFHDAYRLEPWYDRVATELKATKQIVSPLGGIRHLPDIKSGDSRKRDHALRQAINAPVQHLEVMIAYLALWLAYEAGIPLVAFLHDALYAEVPNEQAEQVSAQLKYIMETRVPEVLASEYGYPLEVPLEVDIEAKACYPVPVNA
jgi:DNA polymerase I